MVGEKIAGLRFVAGYWNLCLIPSSSFDFISILATNGAKVVFLISILYLPGASRVCFSGGDAPIDLPLMNTFPQGWTLKLTTPCSAASLAASALAASTLAASILLCSALAALSSTAAAGLSGDVASTAAGSAAPLGTCAAAGGAVAVSTGATFVAAAVAAIAGLSPGFLTISANSRASTTTASAPPTMVSFLWSCNRARRPPRPPLVAAASAAGAS